MHFAAAIGVDFIEVKDVDAFTGALDPAQLTAGDEAANKGWAAAENAGGILGGAAWADRTGTRSDVGFIGLEGLLRGRRGAAEGRGR